MRLWFLLSISFTSLSLGADVGLTFEPNFGQTGADIRYIARASNGVVFVTDRGILLSGAGESVPAFELQGGDLGSEWQPEAATGQSISYFIGRDSSKWIEDLPRYERLVRHNVYPGIDLVLYGTGGQLEYDFELAPHADPSRIRLRLRDAQEVSITPDGTLVAITPAGELRHRAPILTEILPDGSRRNVTGRFRITAPNEVGFAVDGHDPSLALSIDPLLESSTYFGGHGDTQIIATDGKGTLVGNTTSIDIPGGEFARPKGTQLFLAKGQNTSVFGCTGSITATSAVFSSQFSGPILVGGYTDCDDMPLSPPFFQGQPTPALQPNYGGGASDGFLFIGFNTSSPFPYSANFSLTYIGGPGADRVNALAIDPYFGSVAIAGSTEGGLPAPYGSTSQPAAPSGGLDAFVMSILSPNSGVLPFIYITRYLGGSGDDTALGLAMINSNIYVTGETQSRDFPLVKPLYSKRQGDSDAFVADVLLDGTLFESTLLGGSGTDRGVAATVLPSGNIAIAGVTSSTDLPLKNPTQKTYGGGASDAFMTELTPDLSTLVSSTYIGGSDADEATSIASNFANAIRVGGWTASKDFPTVNALQNKYGGGPDDGFLVQFDDDRSIFEATFFGGSGSDHVLGISGNYPLQTSPLSSLGEWMVGTTTSLDLPLQNASQTTLAGASNGFVAEIGADRISVPPFTGGKDLRGSLPIYFDNPQASNGKTFTIASSDTSKVQLALDASSAGQGSVELTPTTNPQYFYVDCLTDSGEAKITISAPGYKTKTTPVTCGASAVYVGYPLGSAPGQFAATQASYIYFGLYPAILPTGTFFIEYSPRPGSVPPTVQISSSKPSVGTVSASSVTFSFTAFQTVQVTFSPVAIGSTELTFDAGSLPVKPSNSVTAVVLGSYGTVAPFAVPAGFQARLYLTSNGRGSTKTATITSHDPSRIKLSLDPNKVGGASVTFPSPTSAYYIWVQAVGSSGSTAITISPQGEQAISTTVSITAPVATLQYGTNTGQPIPLRVGGSAEINLAIQGADPKSLTGLAANPNSPPLKFSLQPSQPGIVKVSPASLDLANPAPLAPQGFQMTGVAPGTAVLSITSSAKISSGPPFPTATVNVTQGSVLFPGVEVGKNLMAPMTLTLPAPAKSDLLVTTTVSDTTQALLSPDGAGSGLAQITTVILNGNTSTSFYVYGLASSGQVKVSAAVPGYGTVTANVNLDRAGFFWAQGSTAINVPQSQSVQQNVQFGPLDSATGLPIGQQALRPGLTIPLSITSSHSGVVSLSPKPLTIPLPPNGGLQLKGVAPGSTTLTIVQPPGFSAPSVLQNLEVTVPKPTPPTLSLAGGQLFKDLQTQLMINGFSGNGSLTVKSNDPSKVLLTTDPTKLGTASVTSKELSIYAQCLAASGTVTITVSAPNYPPASASFTLASPGLGIALSGQSTNQNGVYTLTTQSSPVNIAVIVYTAPNQTLSPTFVPGIAPLTATVTSSNTGVAVITGSPVTLSSTNNPPPVNLFSVAPGETTISITQPPGYTSMGNDHFTVKVVAPTLGVNNFSAAKDTVTISGVNLGTGQNATANLKVTLTSSDPSRVLLSPDEATTPSASISVTLMAGSYSANFYAHALRDNGTVAVKASAPGYADTSFSVQLAPLAFEFIPTMTPPIQALIQAGPQTVSVTAVALLGPNSSQNGYQLTLRPGVKIAVNVVSSDPSIVAVTTKQVVFQDTIQNTPVTYRPLKPGTATLSLKVPSGYTTVPNQNQVAINAQQATIGLSVTSVQIGKDLQTPINFYLQVPVSDTSVTVTSSNPSVLLVSPDTVTPGQAHVVLSNSSGGFPAVNAQALASSGSATLTFSTPGLPSVKLPVTFSPAGAVFQGQAEQNITTNSGVTQQVILLAPLDPVTLEPGQQRQSARPGANLSVAVTTTDPKIVAVTTPTVEITGPPPAGSNLYAGIQAVGIGTAIVSLGALSGNPLPAIGYQIALDVTEPDISIPPITVGRDLQVPAQITLGSAYVNPSSDTVISVSAPFGVALAANPTDVGQSSLSVTVPAGQMVSKPFYVQGLSTGPTAINYSGGQFQYHNTPVTVTQTAFIIAEAANGPLTIRDDVSANLTVVPTLSPQTMAASGPLSIRGGVTPVSIAIASTDPTVVSVTAAVTFNPGDQKQLFGIHGASPGHANVKLLGTNYDFSQPQASIQVTVQSVGAARP